MSQSTTSFSFDFLMAEPDNFWFYIIYSKSNEKNLNLLTGARWGSEQ